MCVLFIDNVVRLFSCVNTCACHVYLAVNLLTSLNLLYLLFLTDLLTYLLAGAWLTPNQFQQASGRGTARDWKRSIKHHGTSLKSLISSRVLSVDPPLCRCAGCTGSAPVNGHALVSCVYRYYVLCLRLRFVFAILAPYNFVCMYRVGQKNRTVFQT